MTGNAADGGASRYVAIVTGAAAGMGAASAQRLAKLGHPLILCDLNADRLDAMADTLRAGGATVEVLAGDVSDPAWSDRLADMLGERPIGAIVHAAGLSPSRGEADTILRVNYDASLRLVLMAQPRMAKGACAVLISSSSAYSAASPQVDAMLDALPIDGDSAPLRQSITDPGAAYAISKRGVQRIVERHAPAFGARGARIMSISPGLIDTEMGRDEQKAHPIMAKMLEATPLARQGSADEIASVAVFLCSPEASFVTGSDIKVDGGVLAVMK